MTNHLWQSTVFAVTAALLAIVLSRNRAQVRYWLWFSASLKFLIPFWMLISLGSQVPWRPATQRMVTPAVLIAMEEISQPFPEVAPVMRTAEKDSDWGPLAIVAVWFAGFAAVTLRRSRGWFRIRAAVRAGKPLDIAGAVEARLSPGRLEPGVFGVTRPILLLPEGIVERLTPSQLEAVVAHELCHVRRRDNLFAAIHMVVEAVFWFHPLVWWIGARMVEERERACDEDVVRLGNEPRVYADAIVNVCKLYVESPLACVAGVSGSDIRRRLEAIMTNRMGQSLGRAKRLLLATAALAAIALPLWVGVIHAPAIHAQQGSALQTAPAPAPQTASAPVPTPKFDAVSIKPCQPGDGPGRNGGKMGGGADPNMPEGVGGYFSVSPGRLNVTCGSILSMIESAYIGLGGSLLNNPGGPLHAGDLVQGLPKWALAPRYTVHAETDDPVANGPTQAVRGRGRPPAANLMYGPMMQGLLEDRFQLKLHRETEQAPMYALTVAKGGFKLKPMKEGDCTKLEQGQGMKEVGVGDKPYCNWTGWPLHGPNRTLMAGSITMDRLAKDLGELVMDRNVIDRTGISGEYNVLVEYAPDETTRCFGPPEFCAVDPTSDIPPAGTIFAALQQQLGLKLEQIMGPREHIVIDRVERPSEN